MIELNSPTVFGFEITAWFVTFCISLVFAVVFLVLLCIGVFNKSEQEDNMIIKATDNVAKIPVKKLSTPNLNSSVMSGNVAEREIPSKQLEIYKTEEANPPAVQDNSLYATAPVDEVSEANEISGETKFCIYCGKPADGKFCIYCGKEIK